MERKDADALLKLATAQVEAGADYIDVNVGTGKGDSETEQEDMAWAAETIQKAIDVPLVIDSADPRVIEAGLKRINKKQPIINSVSGKKKSLESVLVIAKEFDAKIIALAMDDDGIPNNIEGRLSVCEKVLETAKRIGIDGERLIFDPLVMPISVQNDAAKIALEAFTQIKKLLPFAETVLGISNISYGLPNRSVVNAAFLSMAVEAGLDYAIVDPLDAHLMHTLRATLAILDQDKYCRKYITGIRKKRKGEGKNE